MNNWIDLNFADGEYDFKYTVERINELQVKCEIGIGGLFRRLLKGVVVDPMTGQYVLAPAQADFYLNDIVETIKQGLIGGGRGVVNGEEIKVTLGVADRLVRNYVLDRPLSDSWSIAVAALGACIRGYDPPKKDEPPSEGATETTDTSITA